MFYFIYLLLFFGFSGCEGKIHVNDREINVTTTWYGDKKHDAYGLYSYFEGEVAKITCIKATTFNYVKLIFNVSGTEHTTGTDERNVDLYLKLKRNLSPTYIECSMTQLFKKTKYTIRLFLTSQSGLLSIEYPEIEVNGLSLTPSLGYFNIYNFVYEYYPGEDLLISSKLNQQLYVNITCSSNTLPNNTLQQNSSLVTELELNIDPQKLNASQVYDVNCWVQKVAYDAKFVEISIKLMEYTMKFYPEVIGIPWPKIIAKFYRDVKRKLGNVYVSTNSNGNDTVALDRTTSETCFYSATATETKNILLSSTQINLNKNIGSLYYCTYNNTSISKVILIQQPIETTTTTTTPVAPTAANTDINASSTNEANPKIPVKPDDATDGKPFSVKKYLTIIIAVVLIILILFIIVTLVVCFCKRKKLPKTDTDINYENLPAHNEGPMTTPSQWETNSFRIENIEDAYAQVVPKSQRTKMTDIYSEPLSDKESLCYATPYNSNSESPHAIGTNHENSAYVSLNSESPYAEIMPKFERKENVSNDPAKVDEYAQIIPKTLRNVSTNQVLPTSGDCTENATKIRNRVDTDKHKYANLFNSEMYANVD